MKVFGLIGHPLGHSKSPKLHKIIASYFSRQLVYKLFDMDHIDKVKPLIEGLKNGIYHGFNVTIPYKEAVLPFLDIITPKAQKIGAVNTIYFKDNQVIGDNTDYDGFLYLIKQQSIIKKIMNPIILGSGGAAKSSYAVLKDLGFDPVVVSRNPKDNVHFNHIISYDKLPSYSYDLVVNTTPIGMHPNINQSPLDESLVHDKFVIDLIYNPLETTLMKYAKHSIGGLDMLIVQAFKAQNIWFGEEKELKDDILNHIKEDVYE